MTKIAATTNTAVEESVEDILNADLDSSFFEDDDALAAEAETEVTGEAADATDDELTEAVVAAEMKEATDEAKDRRVDAPVFS